MAFCSQDHSKEGDPHHKELALARAARRSLGEGGPVL